MTRKNLAANNLIGIRTPNGGVLTGNNAMTKQSAKAQRTAMWTKVIAVREDGTTYTTSKGELQKETLKQNLKNFIDRF